MGHLRVTIGHLRVTIGHLRVTIGHLRVIMGHLRLTIGYLWVTVVHIRSPKGNYRSPLGNYRQFFSLSKHEANTTELHPKVRQTCFFTETIIILKTQITKKEQRRFFLLFGWEKGPSCLPSSVKFPTFLK